jgi:glucose-1-phosphatase
MPCWAHHQELRAASESTMRPSFFSLMNDPRHFPNIIFDLGGVLLNIDYHLTIKAFEKLGFKDFSDTYTQLAQSELFDKFERGEITPEEFRHGIRPSLQAGVTDAEIDGAWNVMLLDLPTERLTLLQALGASKRIFLLSNTNAIHVSAFEQQVQAQHGINGLAGLFEAAYYSCDVGMRKPEKRIFQMVTEENGLIPSETLFIDDSPQHVEGARNAGLHAYHLTGGETVLNILGQRS